MNTKAWRAVAAATALAAGVAAARDAEDEVVSGEDWRVKRALEEMGMPYRIDEHWRFVLSFEGVEEERTQLVFVESRTSELDEYEIREIYGLAYSGKPLGKAQLEELLEGNSRYKLGAWEVSPPDTGEDGRRFQQVRYSVRIAADASPETLRTATGVVSDMCDRLELDWLGTDDW